MARIKGPRKVHRYSAEFKLKAAKLSQIEGVQVQDVADALDIHPFMLSRWRKEAREGRVTEVRGADSLVVVYGASSQAFRLDGIRVSRDLPPLAQRATAMLRERLVGKHVQIRIRGYVEGGKVPIGSVLVAGADVGVDMIAEGLVVYCPRHLVEVKLQEAQRLAKEAKRGLWSNPPSAGADPCSGAV
ncbi:MAG: hypothetical protein A2Y78_00475 [Acidobacteria bacterium RBG_13_68_16]|nr:MAG: hypothetical protein A2Y78_00475 [Acidobacteria bacterium RBG_13_68_16]